MKNDEHLKEHNNGELQLAHWNAVKVTGDTALANQIEAIMEERGWEVTLDTPPAGNPTWTYHGRE